MLITLLLMWYTAKPVPLMNSPIVCSSSFVSYIFRFKVTSLGQPTIYSLTLHNTAIFGVLSGPFYTSSAPFSGRVISSLSQRAWEKRFHLNLSDTDNESIAEATRCVFTLCVTASAFICVIVSKAVALGGLIKFCHKCRIDMLNIYDMLSIFIL